MKTDAEAVARRIYLFMFAVASAGVCLAWILAGQRAALGFIAGSAVAFANAWWMHRVAASIGRDGKKPKAAIVFAVLRYLLMLMGLYAILNVSETGFLAALAGCFVHLVAVVLEVVFELTYGTS